MSNIKQLVMENEDKFWDIAYRLMGEHEMFIDFEHDLYTNHEHLVSHLNWEDISDNLQEHWNDHCQKYAEMNIDSNQ